MRKEEVEKRKLELKASPPSLLDNAHQAFAGLRGEVPAGDGAGYRWPRWYALVLGALAAEILFFAYLTRLFS